MTPLSESIVKANVTVSVAIYIDGVADGSRPTIEARVRVDGKEVSYIRGEDHPYTWQHMHGIVSDVIQHQQSEVTKHWLQAVQNEQGPLGVDSIGGDDDAP